MDYVYECCLLYKQATGYPPKTYSHAIEWAYIEGLITQDEVGAFIIGNQINSGGPLANWKPV